MRDERTYKIIGAAMEVHRELGCGFLEAVYQEAMEREFTVQIIPFKAQPSIEITYKGQPLKKTYQPDFVCFVTYKIFAFFVPFLALLNAIVVLFNRSAADYSLEHKRFVYNL